VTAGKGGGKEGCRCFVRRANRSRNCRPAKRIPSAKEDVMVDNPQDRGRINIDAAEQASGSRRDKV
jgi:hypothetical protein